MAMRSRLSRGASKRIFRKSAGTMNQNVSMRPMRGGWRL